MEPEVRHDGQHPGNAREADKHGQTVELAVRLGTERPPVGVEIGADI